MTKLEHIEKSVTDLAPDEFQKFAAWFERLQATRWDAQIQADAERGALDNLADSAISDFRAGRTRKL
ncbi:hypothetical protein QO002_003423 [Pararhizobium capsulatum DSM 1112]|uniref:Uncharacterized protein n=1 Tax=Pararhizobium capsulatum DSM 1112 TaxID=1121113 RepID=A0ABU0BSQ4_9HYPH|nr:hypothetical protein [Pararhizobium capsulatum]MDQ0321285.1 hypothetical protein [Pararhizobium capsulatum DSM 1112]